MHFVLLHRYYRLCRPVTTNVPYKQSQHADHSWKGTERCRGSLVERVARSDSGKLSALEATHTNATLAGHLVRLHDELHI